jgi:transcriptional regulator with XRE-family HTH domain
MEKETNCFYNGGDEVILVAEEVTFAQRLKELRKEKDLTQYKLAEELGFSRGLIGNYELGTREPDHTTTKILADFFDVSIDYLLGRTNVRNPRPVSGRDGKDGDDDWYIAAFEGYHELPSEAREQLKDYLEFLKSKYGKKPDSTDKGG